MNDMDNYLAVTTGFKKLLGVLGPYVARELTRAFGDDWWQVAVLNKLYDDQRRGLPLSGDYAELVDSLDEQRCLLLVEIWWREVFGKRLPRDCKNWAIELKGARNEWAHAGGGGISSQKAARMLDTMQLLCAEIDLETAEEIRALHRTVLYGSEAGSAAARPAVAAQTPPAQAAARRDVQPATIGAASLPSWRDVMEPHPDVAEGRYRQAEFAADLNQVVHGKGSIEYRDPVEFFGRTYITDGMRTLLVQAIRRVSGQGGEPVVQLKTAFGGGKTHSMLALYHLLRGTAPLARIPSLKPVVESPEVGEAGLQVLARGVNVAVIVGTALDPSTFQRPANLPGATVNTLWGEIAYQLAVSAGRPELYDYVKRADKKGTSPGSEALTALFDDCGPCLILIDELVAYAKKIFGVEGLPAGSFDNLVTFVQELTEAARASKNSIVVASIPESEREIGGEAGQKALEAIEHTFGRMEAIWKPVTADEGFEVVRRRLFRECSDPAAREHVCQAYSRYYNDNAAEFPVEAKTLDYKKKMLSCYPIHPEVFERLYNEWATLPTFQRTRGVLRLMAGVIHELWVGGDESPMIMPGSLPLCETAVRDELTRYLDPGWNSIVESEIDGRGSVSYKTDDANQRFGKYLASRRIARTLMLGSAPDVAGQDARGLEIQEVMLGTVQPGEPVSTFRDALVNLKLSSSFLYGDDAGRRYWYDTRPTLQKTVADRTQQISDDTARYEVEERLKKLKPKHPFSRVHVCPAGSQDVPDTQELGLVVLPLDATFRAGADGGAAVERAGQILDSRGDARRLFRNMLVFVAPDQGGVHLLFDEMKRLLAWSSILEDRETLNLDASQEREAHNNIEQIGRNVDYRIRETYRYVLSPRADASAPAATSWESYRVGAGEDVVDAAAGKLLDNEDVVVSWAGVMLKLELDRLLWKDSDHILVKTLWEYLCSYCYLPRLASFDVLQAAIVQGLPAAEHFAIASGVEDGRYLGLRLGETVSLVSPHDYLVKVDVARRQLEAEAAHRREEERRRGEEGAPGGRAGTGAGDGAGSGGGGEPERSGAKTVQKSFRLYAELDPVHVIHDVDQIMEEVVGHLQVPGASVRVHLEVGVDSPEGFDVPTQRTVTENCRTLGVEYHTFSD